MTIRTKILTILVLLVGVVGLGIGFASFSKRLTISSALDVRPDSSSFNVDFSTGTTSMDKGYVKPTLTGGATSTTAQFDNTGDPTLTGIQAIFTGPGQSVTYNFNVLNLGAYTAHLNSITYNNVSGKNLSKVCTVISGTTDSFVQSICKNISVTITVGDTVTSTSLGSITGNKLEPGEYTNVKVVVAYTGSTEIQGKFSVEFGDIVLSYGSVEGLTPGDSGSGGSSSQSNVCTLADANSNSVADVGEIVTCGSGDTAQSFYVMPDHDNAEDGTISMMAQYNLDVGNIYNTSTKTATAIEKPTGLQSSRALGFVNGVSEYYGVVDFSTSNYWDSSVEEGTFVYNDQALISEYVNAYKDKLIEMGVSSDIVATLPSYNQLIDSRIGCSIDDMFCTGPSWVYTTTYWVGSAHSNVHLFIVFSDSMFDYVTYDGANIGVRPIIIISEDDIGIS